MIFTLAVGFFFSTFSKFLKNQQKINLKYDPKLLRNKKWQENRAHVKCSLKYDIHDPQRTSCRYSQPFFTKCHVIKEKLFSQPSATSTFFATTFSVSLVEVSLTKTKHKQAGENTLREWLESEANLSRKSFSRVSFGVVQSFGIFTATFPLSFAPEHTLHLVKCHVVTRV